jgi:hypothetical protein
MFFLKTSRDELISLACVAGVVEREHADGTRRVFAILHPGYGSQPVELSRHYSLESLWLALDPVRRR